MERDEFDEIVVSNEKVELGTFPTIHGTNGIMNTPENREMENAYVGDSVIQVGDRLSEKEHTFTEFCRLRAVVLSNSVRIIEQKAFAFCYGLKEIQISENILYIGPSAFYSCMNLQSIDLYAGIKMIDYWAFAGCNELKEVRYHGSLQQFNLIKFGKGCFHKGLKIICDDEKIEFKQEILL